MYLSNNTTCLRGRIRDGFFFGAASHPVTALVCDTIVMVLSLFWTYFHILFT